MDVFNNAGALYCDSEFAVLTQRSDDQRQNSRTKIVQGKSYKSNVLHSSKWSSMRQKKES